MESIDSAESLAPYLGSDGDHRLIRQSRGCNPGSVSVTAVALDGLRLVGINTRIHTRNRLVVKSSKAHITKALYDEPERSSLSFNL
jgi:hypothetical protein